MSRRKLGASLSQRPWFACSELKSFQVARETLFLQTLPPPSCRALALGKQTCSLSPKTRPNRPACPPLSQH